MPYWGIGLCYEQKGMYQEAVDQLQKAIAVSGRGANSIASLGHAYGLAGQHGEAQKILAELEKRSKKTYVSSYQIALVYLGQRQNDKATPTKSIPPYLPTSRWTQDLTSCVQIRVSKICYVASACLRRIRAG